MKITITTIAAALFVGSASAAEPYRGLDVGNLDLDAGSVGREVFSGMQPGVGRSRYRGRFVQPL